MSEIRWTLTDLSEGTRGRLIVYVLDRQRRSTTDRKPYAELTVCDRSGRCRAVKWDLTEDEWAILSDAEYLEAEGTMKSYRRRGESLPSFNIDRFRIVQDQNPADFLPAFPEDTELHWQRCTELVRGVADPDLQALLRSLFGDEDFRRRYCHAPAAQARHHAYRGGLMEHSVEVADLCLSVCDHLPDLDRDLLIAAALLHDVGKIEEIRADRPGYEFTADGALMGHITLGADLVRERIAGLPGFSDDTRQRLLHLILSHHGKKEWGSPVEPATAEALLLHACDQISVQMFYCAEARERAGSHPFAWVDGLERRVYLPRREVSATPEGDGADPFPFTEGAFRIEPPRQPAAAPAFPGEWEGMALLPIYGCIAAGSAIRVEQNLEGFRAATAENDGGDDFYLRVSGDSMRDAHILDGDLVRVRPNAAVREGSIVAALVDGDATVKRFQRGGGGVILKAENPDYPDIVPASVEDFSIQGVVVGLVRERLT